MVDNFLKDGGQLPQDLSRDLNLAAALIEALTTKTECSCVRNIPIGSYPAIAGGTFHLPAEYKRDTLAL